MNQKKTQAVSSFRSGFNCAQSVLIAHLDNYNIDRTAALTLAAGFGAGMGRLQETCGAVTGSYMVIGSYISKNFSESPDKKDKMYGMIQEFSRRFSQLNGTTLCADLLKVDLKTEIGQKAFNEMELGTKVCEKCIADAVQIIHELTA